MSYKPKDRIGDFVKNKIELDVKNQSAWNTPPDDVFFNAMEVIDERKKVKNKKALIIILSLLFLTATFGYLFVEKARLSALSENINQVKYEIEQLNLKLSQEQSSAQNEIHSGTIKSRAESNVNSKGNNDIASDKFQKKVAPTSSIQRNVSQGVSANSFIHSNTNTNTNQTSIKKSNFVNQNNSYNINRTTHQGLNLIAHGPSKEVAHMGLNSIPTKGQAINENLNLIGLAILQNQNILLFKISSKIPDLNLVIPQGITAEQNVNQKRWTLGLFVNQNLSSLDMNPSLTQTDATLTEYDKYYYGRGVSTQLSYDLNAHFYASLNLSYNEYRNSSLFEESALYSKSNEYSSTNGDVVYQDEMDIQTPFGSYMSEMNFDVSPNHVNENDLIQQVSRISQNFATLGASLNIGYKQNLSSKLEWFSEVGLGYNYLFNLSNEMQTQVIMDNQILCRMSDISEGMPNLNRGFSFYNMATGLNYHVKDNMDLNFGLSYLNSISSLREIPSSLDPSLDLNQFQLRIGSQLRF